MRTIELTTPMDFRIHGNLTRTPMRQLLRRVGTFRHIAFASSPELCGTVADKQGKHWDWWMEGGEVVVMPAK